MTYALFAYDGNSLHFDQTHAKQMRLPFNQGWDKWVVMEVGQPNHFKKVFESEDYQKVEEFLSH